MRSGTGTKSGEPSLVTFSTKVTMDCLAGPSFHEGSGSTARARVVVKASAQTSAAARWFWMREVFMVVWVAYFKGHSLSFFAAVP
jgi:hypothetical protein